MSWYSVAGLVSGVWTCTVSLKPFMISLVILTYLTYILTTLTICNEPKHVPLPGTLALPLTAVLRHIPTTARGTVLAPLQYKHKVHTPPALQSTSTCMYQPLHA
jgi:hypothetical protein